MVARRIGKSNNNNNNNQKENKWKDDDEKRLFLRLKCFDCNFSIREKRQINNIQLQTIKEKTCLTSHRLALFGFLIVVAVDLGLAGNKRSGATTQCVCVCGTSSTHQIISNTTMASLWRERGNQKKVCWFARDDRKKRQKEEKKRVLFLLLCVYNKK